MGVVFFVSSFFTTGEDDEQLMIKKSDKIADIYMYRFLYFTPVNILLKDCNNKTNQLSITHL